MPLLEIYDFTPVHAVIGGVLLGTAAVMRMWLSGRILGVSGQAGGLVRGKAQEAHRWLFVSGLVAGGLGLGYAKVYPPAFGEIHTALWRSLVGGVAVGLGAGLGNGCTSGHGICGNARLSSRSLYYTVTFMATGFAVGSLLGSATHVTTDGLPQLPAAALLQLALVLLAGHLAAYAAVVALASLSAVSQPLATDVLSFIDGSLFACGLGLSGMTSPARVAQFLDVSKGTWNPTLAFVMGGGLGVTAPFLLLLVLPRRIAAPMLGKTFELPTNPTIDRKLILGGVLFGARAAERREVAGPATRTPGRPPPLTRIFRAPFAAPQARAGRSPACARARPSSTPPRPTGRPSPSSAPCSRASRSRTTAWSAGSSSRRRSACRPERACLREQGGWARECGVSSTGTDGCARAALFSNDGPGEWPWRVCRV